MKTCLADYECLVPSSVEEALEQRRDRERLIPIAGGTDVMVWMNFGVLPGPVYQSLHRLASRWRYVREDEWGGLRSGALATYTDVRRHPIVQRDYPLLVEAARVTGRFRSRTGGRWRGTLRTGLQPPIPFPL
jgi:CO/xanthine dehydrogenase FAD-binding subunit